MKSDLLLHRFTVEQYNHMAENGILSENDKVELLRGKIVDMTPIGSRHASCVTRLSRLFDTFIIKDEKPLLVSVQNPLQIDDYSEPEPDIMLLKYRDDFYRDNHPEPDDVLLIVEAADRSLNYDRSVKIPLYAQAEIKELWLLNLIDDDIEIYRDPLQGRYTTIIKALPYESLSPLLIPELSLSVSEILGHD